MDNTPPAPEYIQPPAYDPYSIDFKFMVFQGNPKLDSIYYWLDGAKEKHKMMRDVFMKLIRMSDENMVADAYHACSTYSFYLWDKSSNKVVHLTPKGTNEDPYQDSLQNVIQGKIAPIRRGNKVIAENNIEYSLMQYGFNTPSEYSTKNMQFSMEKKSTEKEDKFSVLRSLLSGRRK